MLFVTCVLSNTLQTTQQLLPWYISCNGVGEVSLLLDMYRGTTVENFVAVRRERLLAMNSHSS